VTAARTERRSRRIGSMEVLLASLIALALFAGAMSAFVAGNADVGVAATVFCGVFVQALPFLVLGVVVSGLIAAFVSADRLARWLPRRPAVAVQRCRAANVARCRWRADCSGRASPARLH
jgi:uncharacterized membrane protein YraQ (UPF0718 family)